MKATEIIENKLSKLPECYIFTFSDITSGDEKKEAIIKALNRMVGSGKLGKLAKGKFYKPKSTVFGELQPNQSEFVKDLLENNGKVTGYVTGYSVFNQLRLTTQLSNVIHIGKNDIRPSLKRGYLKISFIKQRNIITKDNIPFLQILDAIRYIKKIPDTSVTNATRRIRPIIKELSSNEKQAIAKLALKYPPSTRAML